MARNASGFFNGSLTSDGRWQTGVGRQLGSKAGIGEKTNIHRCSLYGVGNSQSKTSKSQSSPNHTIMKQVLMPFTSSILW
jgi:hypothetical protein